jgi:1,4-dihydroxy-6-naphthoate synthase
MASRITLRIGHSPDPDDAFMWYPLANFPDGGGPGGHAYHPQVDTGRFEFVHVLEDIQSLNDRAERGELEITALSVAQYPHVAERYVLTRCGASMGEGYGPMLVAREAVAVRDLVDGDVALAIPGRRTSAWLALRLHLLAEGVDPDRVRALDPEVVPFDQIIPAVADGRFEAGLIIHEGQLTFGEWGLRCMLDLGQWWSESHGLPLPLGGNAIRRDLEQAYGEGVLAEISTVLLASIRYALEHREEAIGYALNYARDMGRDLADRFVGMYVNRWTLDYGPRGEQAVRELLTQAQRAGLAPATGPIAFV